MPIKKTPIITVDGKRAVDLWTSKTVRKTPYWWTPIKIIRKGYMSFQADDATHISIYRNPFGGWLVNIYREDAYSDTDCDMYDIDEETVFTSKEKALDYAYKYMRKHGRND